MFEWINEKIYNLDYSFSENMVFKNILKYELKNNIEKTKFQVECICNTVAYHL